MGKPKLAEVGSGWAATDAFAGLAQGASGAVWAAIARGAESEAAGVQARISRMVTVEDGASLFERAHEHWPAPRCNVELDRHQLAPVDALGRAPWRGRSRSCVGWCPLDRAEVRASPRPGGPLSDRASDALGEDPRPRDREPVRRRPERPHQCDVLL